MITLADANLGSRDGRMLNMMRVQLRYPRMEAQKVTAENLDAVAAWIAGSVVGMRLLPPDRAVMFTNYDHDENEVNVGEWIVRFELADGRRNGMVLPQREFDLLFEEVRG